jgi:hypothetical protein
VRLDAGEFVYLLQYFSQIGAGKQTSGTFVPLEWPDIKAWCDITGIALDGWEVRTLLDMSFGYVEIYDAARKPVCFPPDGSLYLFEEDDG